MCLPFSRSVVQFSALTQLLCVFLCATIRHITSVYPPQLIAQQITCLPPQCLTDSGQNTVKHVIFLPHVNFYNSEIGFILYIIKSLWSNISSLDIHVKWKFSKHEHFSNAWNENLASMNIFFKCLLSGKLWMQTVGGITCPPFSRGESRNFQWGCKYF